MILKEKIYYSIFVIAILTFSYSICSTHELRHPNSFFNTSRNRFCATPYWFTILITVCYIFFYL